MARAANSPLFGQSAEGFETAANNFLAVTSFLAAAVYSPIRRNFLFWQFWKSNKEVFCCYLHFTVLLMLFHLFPRKPVNHVMNQSKQQALSFIVCRRGLGRTVARKFSTGGLCVSAGWLDILKFDKNFHWFIVSCFNLGGLGALFGGLSQPKLPLGDGTRFRTGVAKFSLAMYPSAFR